MSEEIVQKEKELPMSFPHLHFQLEVILEKIKWTAFFIHQTLSAILKKHKHDIRTIPDESDQERIRRIVAFVRHNEKTFLDWKIATTQKNPHLEKLCNVAGDYYVKIMNIEHKDVVQQHTNIDGFWRHLFDYLMTLSFINPQFFIHNEYPLERSIRMVEEGLKRFIIHQVELDIERSTLTMSDLAQFDNSYTAASSPVSTISTYVPTQISTTPLKPNILTVKI